MRSRILLASSLFAFLAVCLSVHSKTSPVVTSTASHSETNHVITLNGKVVNYKATVGIMPIYANDSSHSLKATMSYIAYTAAGEKNRPVTFVWCGGPGQSSLSANFYLSGPKIFNSKTKTLENNPQTWLRYTDLVYIDMVGTGWGRPASKGFAKQIYSEGGDARTFTQFIENYLKQNNKPTDNIYLYGESYGGIRAQLVANNLLKDDIAIKGMILMSPELNDYYNHPAIFGTDMPYIFALPTFIRAALYHHKLSPEFQNNPEKTIKEGEAWALNNYPTLLLKGDSISQSEKTALETHLKNYTGLSAELIRDNHYRISTNFFGKHIVLDKNKRLDYLDTRMEDDFVPYHDALYYLSIESLMKSQLVLYPVALEYIKNKLNFTFSERFINYQFPDGWQFDPQYKQVLSVLRSNMIINNNMKLFVALGHYDADIPYMVNVVAINHLLLPESIRKNIVVHCYEGGHMLYLDNLSIQTQLNKEIEKLYS